METRPYPDRSKILRPFLEAIRSGRLTPIASPEPPTPWEQEATEHPDPDIVWHRLIRECHAWRELSDQDLNPPDETLPVHARLMDDATIGFAIAADLQRTVDDLVLSGDMTTAKKLSQFRNRFMREISALEKLVGGENLDQCRTLGTELAAANDRLQTAGGSGDASVHQVSSDESQLQELLAEAEAAEPHGSLQATFEKEHGAVNFTVREAAPDRRAVSWLIGTMVVLAVIWIVRIGIPMWTAPHIPKIDLLLLNHSVILYSEALPPTVYVTLDGRQWAELSAGGRRELIESARVLIEPAGYQGALFRTREGISVGQWLKNSGIRLLEERNGS